MSWFWGSSDKSNKSEDPYKKLDAGLRDFLDKESPAKNEDSNRSPQAPLHGDSSLASSTVTPHAPTTNYRAELGLDTPGVNPENQSTSSSTERPAVPRESLFQDGRYAHLWKGYRSQAEVDSTARSDQDRMSDIADIYHERQAAIGRAALENCTMEQIAESDCFKHGGLKQTMTMCRTEARAFSRCYMMQARFLKALGYLSSAHHTPEEEEKIQMHADKLYHEMLEREQAQKEADEAGREAPAFQPLIQHERVEEALGADSAWSRARRRAEEQSVSLTFSNLSHEKQVEIKEKLKGMSETQKELELQLIAAEHRAQLEYAEQVEAEFAKERRARAERREQGKETFGDTMKRLWGWNSDK